MKRWIALLMCAVLLGIGLVAMAQDVSGDPAAAGTVDAPSSGLGGILGGGWQGMVILFAVFGAIFYFMLIRPQRKRQAKMTELLGGLKRGDSVVTAGGIHGEIDSIGDTAAVLILEDGGKLKVAKSSVVKKIDK